MSRAHNGIHDPNAEPKIRIVDNSHDGKKALKYALAVGVVIMGNFGIGGALQSAADSIYEGGYFKDGMYLVNKPGVDAVFYCNDAGNVIREDTIVDEMGEGGVHTEDIGSPTSCPELTERDGKFWQEKINQLGLVGLAYEQFN